MPLAWGLRCESQALMRGVMLLQKANGLSMPWGHVASRVVCIKHLMPARSSTKTRSSSWNVPIRFGISLRGRGRNFEVGALAILCLVVGAPFASAQTEQFVAGTTPDRRPASPPRISTFNRTTDWNAQAHAGIATPLPPLSFLKDQGAWYTPFTRPGMPGPYDIRSLHSPREAANAPAAARKP